MISFAEIITERKLAEEALRRSEADLRATQRHSHVGSWSWDAKTNREEWSDETFRILGIDQDQSDLDLREAFLHAIHPDDVEEFKRFEQKLFQTGIPAGHEYRVVLPDGTVRTVWDDVGELILDQDGKPALLKGYFQDITKLRQAEEGLRRSEHDLKMRSVSPGLVVGHGISREIN